MKTYDSRDEAIADGSRPAWARGLKIFVNALLLAVCQSRPAWARGLKMITSIAGQTKLLVAPRVGAWIEKQVLTHFRFSVSSRPAWARGLKMLQSRLCLLNRLSRPAWARGLKRSKSRQRKVRRRVAPRVGAWIENHSSLRNASRAAVAPRVGAWIENGVTLIGSPLLLSRPAWARGLKMQ